MRSLGFLVCSVCIRTMAMLAILIAPKAARAQWHATVGAQSWDSARQALAFLPNELWIHAGDDVTWTFQAGEIHTVTFLATSPAAQVRPPFPVGCPGFSGEPAMFDGTACISTPPLVKGASFKVAFPAVGNFKLVCLVHPDMTGVVHVLDKAKPLPHDQIFYDAEAAAQAQALLWTCRTTFVRRVDCLTVSGSTFRRFEKPSGQRVECFPLCARPGSKSFT